MAKTFKRIAALALALTLVVCFAVSASAAIRVQTTTQYAGSNQNVNVTVNVSGISGADYVTYYATKDDVVVYVDQTDVTDAGSATISYQTAATNLNGTVKVGYTDGAATNWEIDGYAVSAGAYTVTPAVIPTSGNATVKIAYEATAGKTYDSLDVDGATIVGVPDFSNNVITVTLSGASEDVTITVNEKNATGSNAVATALDAGYKAVDNTRKITVLGAATGAQEYGVIITTNEIESTYETVDAFNAAFTANEKFAAVGTPGQNGVFAVQVIDDGVADEALFVEGTSYNVAVYVKNVDGSYTTNAADDIVVQ